MNIIRIEILGKVQTGKSALLQSIHKLLLDNNYCVAIPNREERHNPSSNLNQAASHERPNKDETVIILTEMLEA